MRAALFAPALALIGFAAVAEAPPPVVTTTAPPSTAPPLVASRPEPKPAPTAEPTSEKAPSTPPLAKPQAPVSDPSDAALPADTPAKEVTETVTETAPNAATEQPLHSTLQETDFDYSACLFALYRLGATYEELPAITEAENKDCGIDRPVQISQILPGLTLAGSPVMRCDTARHLALWLRDYVRPSAAMLPGAPRITGIEPGSTYQCRAVVGGTSRANVSEHALGNAFDIAAFTFDDGTRLEIQPRKDSGTLAEAFQSAIRSTACLHFTTVLGPGANEAHDDHLHLDIKARRGGFRLCQ